MNEEGISEEKIYDLLNQKLEKDLDYDTGKILGSMCTKPHEFAIRIFSQYAEKNLTCILKFSSKLKLIQIIYLFFLFKFI